MITVYENETYKEESNSFEYLDDYPVYLKKRETVNQEYQFQY